MIAMDPFRLESERTGPTPGIVTLWLDQGDRPVVVLDHPLIQRLEATLKSLPSNAEGLILASAAPRAFVAGADLAAGPACWLDEVCPDCGAIPEGEHDCPRAPTEDRDGGVQSRS